MKLGILLKNGIIVNHRSLLKVLFNPILRWLGYFIGSVCKDNEIIGLKLSRCPRVSRIKWDFNSHNDYDTIIKKRVFY